MIAVIDYGIGNTRSIQNALEFLGYDSILTRDINEIGTSDGLILPGVGAFAEGMSRIKKYNLYPIFELAIKQNKPILGICLGFQLFMRSSTELGQCDGLNFIPLEVTKLPSEARLPHIGWATVYPVTDQGKNLKLMLGIENEQFYFVHSYGVDAFKSNNFAHAVARYGSCEIVAAIEYKNIFGTQFHPEKSGEAGLHLLRNFAEVAK